MSDIAAFLLDRYDEEAAQAHAASRVQGERIDDGVRWQWVTDDNFTVGADLSRPDDYVTGYMVSQERRPYQHVPFLGDGAQIALGTGGAIEVDNPVAAHIARHDPARVLADIAVKRRIVKLHSVLDGTGGDWDTDPPARCAECRDEHPCTTLCLLALPYADHPDYDDENWRA